MTIQQVKEFFIDKEHTPCPLTEKLVKAGYLQVSGGYIDRAKKEGVLVDYKKNSPSQFWHLMTYCDSRDGKKTFSKSIVCGELIFWMAEVSGAVDEFMLETLAARIIYSADLSKCKTTAFDRKYWNNQIRQTCFNNLELLIKNGGVKREYDTYYCSYMQLADNSRYLYVHVAISSGTGNVYGMHMFLYDTLKHNLRYSRDYRDILEFRYGIIKEPYFEYDSQEIDDDVRLDDMFSFEKEPKALYGDGSYSLFLKSGNRVKYLSINYSELSAYKPFLWIIEHAEWAERSKTLKRNKIPLRELFQGKYCRCFIPYRSTDGEKCICCERKFHDYPLKSDNVVSLSLMTYIKLYDITDTCYHITIHLDTKKCKCIRVSEDNVESEIELSESLTNVLTSQDNICELLNKKWIEEEENSLYDGNYYYYIIQQGKKFYRGTVACGFVGFWSLFASITNELYPKMEPRRIY
jgi:metal-sulfur cluster biosynthetic enzyme